MKVRTILLSLPALIVLGLLAAEGGLRLAGLCDFPTYRIDEEAGYTLKPDQSGTFFGSAKWSVNSAGMLTSKEFSPAPEDIFLLGDSLVLGSVRTGLEQKLGQQIENQTGRTVWPLCAESWGAENEIVMLEHHLDAFKTIHTLVWLVGSGDFGPRSRWSDSMRQPLRQPPLALSYWTRKIWERKILPKILNSDHVPKDKPLPIDTLDTFVQYLHTLKQRLPRLRIIIIWCPDIREIKWDPVRQVAAMREALLKEPSSYEWVDVGNDPRWNPSLYQDLRHPNAGGVGTLSAIISEAVKKSPSEIRPDPSAPAHPPSLLLHGD